MAKEVRRNRGLYECAYCGAYLDAGEHCDCLEREHETVAEWARKIRIEDGGQMAFEAAYAG